MLIVRDRLINMPGNVFEKRLIEAYIAENGRDPVTNEELSTDDLVELKTSRTVRPRPPTLTSIPSLLSVFQNEWDALALETYTLRQQLIQARQELSTALYQHDAAVRVIARLSQERDEAREALSKVSVLGAQTANGEAMQVDNTGLSSDLIAKVEATQEKYDIRACGRLPSLHLTDGIRLSKTRRKRTPPEDWVTSDSLNSFALVDKSEALYTGVRSFALNTRGDLALAGGREGQLGVYSMSEKAITREMNAGPGSITDVLWIGERAAASTSTGNVKIWENGTEVASFAGHAGEVTALAIHPSGDILASVGIDNSYIFYDLSSSTIATRVLTNAGKSQIVPDVLLPLSDDEQHLRLPVSIQTATCSLLVAWTAKSKSTTLRARPTPQILSLQGR